MTRESTLLEELEVGDEGGGCFGQKGSCKCLGSNGLTKEANSSGKFGAGG